MPTSIISRRCVRSLSRNDVSFIFTSDSSATTRYEWRRFRFADFRRRYGIDGSDFLAGKDDVDGVAGLGFRPVEEHVDSLDVPEDKAGISQRGLGGFEIRALSRMSTS